MIRLAIYYTPSANSDLAKTAAIWLGRNNRDGSFQGQPSLFPITEDRLREITKAPFHYGFHGTIVPPFQLAEGVSTGQIEEKLEDFAALHKKFVLPTLELHCMQDFFCLRPISYSQELDGLAREAVQCFHEFRKPATAEELQKRRSAGLSKAQDAMLTTWGYPYVMDEFRFHLTLTGRLSDRCEKEILGQELKKRFSQRFYQAVPFDSLSLFIEIDHAPMVSLRRIPLLQ